MSNNFKYDLDCVYDWKAFSRFLLSLNPCVEIPLEKSPIGYAVCYRIEHGEVAQQGGIISRKTTTGSAWSAKPFEAGDQVYIERLGRSFEVTECNRSIREPSSFKDVVTKIVDTSEDFEEIVNS